MNILQALYDSDKSMSFNIEFTDFMVLNAYTFRSLRGRRAARVHSLKLWMYWARTHAYYYGVCEMRGGVLHTIVHGKG
jgi:hypothetical protein